MTMRSQINDLRPELSLHPLVLQSVAGVSEAFRCLIRPFQPLLEQRASFFLRQEPGLYSLLTPEAVVREALRDLSPLLYSHLPELLRQAEDDYTFKVTAWRLVVRDFDEILRRRFPAWYDNLAMTYRARLRARAELLLTSLGSSSKLAVEEALKETWNTVLKTAPLTDVLTDSGLIEKFIFDRLRRTCYKWLYAHLTPKVERIIAKIKKRPLGDSAINVAVSNFHWRLMGWVWTDESKIRLNPHVPFVKMAYNAAVGENRENARERLIKHNSRNEEKRVRCKTIDPGFFDSLPGHANCDNRCETKDQLRWVQSRLSEHESLLYDLHIVRDLSLPNAAKVLGISSRKAQADYKNMVERLREEAARRG
jgi:hypothetical protein